MPTEIIVMATMAAALILVAGVWADLYTVQEQQVRYTVRKQQVRPPKP